MQGTLVQGIVKWPAGKVFSGEFGNSQNFAVTLTSGEEVKVWFSEGLQPHCSIQKGQRVKLLATEKNGKVKYQLLGEEASNAEPKPQFTKNRTLSDDEKREVAEYIAQRAKLLKFCLEQAKKECVEVAATEESIRTIGITLFLSAKEQFNL